MDKDIKKSLKGPGRLADSLSTLLFYASIILFLAAFNFRDNPGGWQLQIIPNLNGTTIQDVTFTDSVTGYLATGLNNQLGYIFKTTNGGVNWVIKKTNSYNFQRIIFCGKDTGYCNSYDTLFKTTNAGENWFSIPFPFLTFADDMFALNKDTLWFVMSGMFGGIFRSTNGGYNWINQYIEATHYPDKIYMVNKNLGFIRNGGAPFGGYIGRTTNGGYNWTLNTNVDTTFKKMFFLDSLTGYKCDQSIQKTTDGGITWQWQVLPHLNYLNIMNDFSFVNKDTIWGVGGLYYYPAAYRGIIYKTTNGGTNWGYQIPDTSFGITQLSYIDFANKFKGWAFRGSNKYLYTDTGGDSTLYTSINGHENTIVKNFELKQNYPNPYNNTTLIEYYLNETGRISIKIYDIRGREMAVLVNEVQSTGGYGIPVSVQLSSGIYFYKLVYVNRQGEIQSDTRRMMVIK